tara:strand:- start:1681 stop:2712 length:1032 start_codon:yes stop_codon:yes gene_type:complete
MALQSSGPISLSNVSGEFGGTTPHSLSEYYGSDSGVPGSGQIKLSQFYGTSSFTPNGGSPDVALLTHNQNTSVNYSAGTSRLINTINTGKLDLPNIWTNNLVTESVTDQLNFPNKTRYFGNFDGSSNYLYARMDQSSYYSSGNTVATNAQVEDFFNHKHVISMWVKPDTFTSQDGDTEQTLMGGMNTGLLIELDQGKPRYRLLGYTHNVNPPQFYGWSYVSATSNTTISTSQWNHIACVMTGDGDPGNTIKLEVHVDNVLRAVTTATNNNTTLSFGSKFVPRDLYIGMYVFNNTPDLFAFDGDIGMIEFYGNCTDSTSSTIGTSNCNAQVASIWNAHKAKFGR